MKKLEPIIYEILKEYPEYECIVCEFDNFIKTVIIDKQYRGIIHLEISREDNELFAFFLSDLIVKSKYRRQGIGSRLIALCEDISKRLGADSVLLISDEKYTTDMYIRRGYEICYCLENGSYKMKKRFD